MWGAAKREVAPKAADPRSTERRVSLAIGVSSPARQLAQLVRPRADRTDRETKGSSDLQVQRHVPPVKGNDSSLCECDDPAGVRSRVCSAAPRQGAERVAPKRGHDGLGGSSNDAGPKLDRNWPHVL